MQWLHHYDWVQIEICGNMAAPRENKVVTAPFTNDTICEYFFLENVHLEDPEGDGRITLRRIKIT
jgi:hypothetical protein